MVKHNILITFNFNVEIIKHRNLYSAPTEILNTVTNEIIEHINDSIIWYRSKTNFIPYKLINVNDMEKNKFVSQDFETVINIIHQKYNYINNMIYAVLELDFEYDKDILSITDIESLIFDNINETYSNEKNTINIDYETYSNKGRHTYYYSLKITDVPENISFYSKQISNIPNVLSLYSKL